VVLNAVDLNAGQTGGGFDFSAVGVLESTVGSVALTLSDSGVTITIDTTDDAGTLDDGTSTLSFAGFSTITGGAGNDTLVLEN
jgi:hypothetical protein